MLRIGRRKLPSDNPQSFCLRQTAPSKGTPVKVLAFVKVRFNNLVRKQPLQLVRASGAEQGIAGASRMERAVYQNAIHSPFSASPVDPSCGPVDDSFMALGLVSEGHQQIVLKPP